MLHSPRIRPVTAVLHRGGEQLEREELLAVEEPLEIRVRLADGDRPEHALSITMRTPGDDVELAVGFLCSEGIVQRREQIADIACDRAHVRIDLAPGVRLPERAPRRSFVMTSACGVCGRTSLEGLRAQPPGPLAPGPSLPAALIPQLPAALLRVQTAFAATGGIHAAGLFDARGELALIREDVGRHNAVDKVLGALLLAGRLPAHDTVLLVSGRASFELVQKALMAQIPVLAAVGAPSSLAVELAIEAKMTLLGFVRENRFTVYSGHERIAA
ncbi:MAG TPA: formate dehydrogenase accessory sulfurtransferase FdhD [Nannocystis sp.]